ncbi:MAG: tRNA pseudouridine(38-40) synthase TruA [Pantoea sp. Brub]|nr:tRNA pseudouridine(38-40) synthase TruA [Pantoea sp. Brub]
MGIEYDGTNYFGWQRQKEVVSIQEKLEDALSKIANHSINIFCAGRTDVGVHSTGQVIHFETNVYRNNHAWTRGVNSNLPNDIAVLWVKEVPYEFHARYSAIARRYRYIIYNHTLRPAILYKGLTYCYNLLDIQKMQRSSKCLLGENNFSSFCSSLCQLKKPYRNIKYIDIIRHGRYIIFDIIANSFLYHMVRNIVGNLIEIGCDKKPESWIEYLLLSENKQLVTKTAKAKGLYLVKVYYPLRFGLPKIPIGPLFLN